jgi:linoleoyl-CoA desaturase
LRPCRRCHGGLRWWIIAGTFTAVSHRGVCIFKAIQLREPLVHKIRFSAQIGFQETLQQRVCQYFAARKLATTGDWRMFLKTGILLLGFATSYVLLVFFATSLTTTIITAFALAQGCILVSCNIMHDGAHDSFSTSKKINWLMGCTLDVIGGSQMLWRQKHNLLHHTYTNINALDSDLHTSGMLRLHPEQPWWPWHRFQHVYAFPGVQPVDPLLGDLQ